MSMEVEALKERIEELKNEVEELEQAVEESTDSSKYSEGVEDGYDKAMLEVEGKIEHAFSAGYRDISTMNELKSFLNYKMEQGLR